MSKGVLYVMTTVVDGLIKIGKTGTANFEQRMYNLESNGYRNVVGLRRRFAIEVEDYDDKEALLHNIFSKSQVPGTELFALDINLVTQLLSSFEGNVVYPKTETKDEIFDDAVEKATISVDDSTKKRKKAIKFKFSMVGIQPGDTLTYKKGPGTRVIVEDDTHVRYKGEVWSLSALAAELTGTSPVQGTAYFTYNGELLTDMRQRILGDSRSKKNTKKSSK